jgi:hypothetical protein
MCGHSKKEPHETSRLPVSRLDSEPESM